MTNPRLLDAAQLKRLAADSALLAGEDALSAAEIARLDQAWRSIVRPQPKEDELFDLVDCAGKITGARAPRWLCHLLGLCHRTVHLALRTPQGLIALQQRSPSVRNWPGVLDLAVTGHVRAGLDWPEAMAQEAAEELGLDVTAAGGMLAPPGLEVLGGYCRRQTDSENPPEHVCHVTRVYAATLTPAGLASLRFADGEVDGIYLCSGAEAARLVAEERERVAPGLVQSLSYMLAWLSR